MDLGKDNEGGILGFLDALRGEEGEPVLGRDGAYWISRWTGKRRAATSRNGPSLPASLATDLAYEAAIGACGNRCSG